MSSPPRTAHSDYALTSVTTAKTRRLPTAVVVAPTLGAWSFASVCALWLCCGVELALKTRGLSSNFIAYLTALSLTLGLMHGALWGAAFRVLSRVPTWVSTTFWSSAGLSAAVWLAQQLGAFSRLHSRYAQLAQLVLAGAGALGLAFALLCVWLQPSAARPAGRLLELNMRARRLCSCGLILVFAGLWVADKRLFPEQYPLAHVALRLSALWCAMFAVVLGLRRLPQLGVRSGVLGVLAYLACLGLLDERRVHSLDAFDARPWASGVLKLSRSFVDFDRDGHASFLGDTDCEPWDPHVHPGAVEIPGNGLDDNCILGDAQPRTQQRELIPASADPPDLDIVLITVDAWNPAHLGVYNPKDYGPTTRNTTPALDRWAAQATVFERAYTPGGWTSVAVPALLRGVYPRRLQWRKYYETTNNLLLPEFRLKHSGLREHAMHMFPLAFGDPHPTLAEMLKRRGYHTLAITDDGYSAMLQPGTGIERGFDSYRQIDELPEPSRNDLGTANVALETLHAVPDNQRFFLWVHFFGTHYPDTFHEGIRDYGQRPEDLYDHEVAYLDTQLKRVLDELSKRKHPVAVFLTADHSEGLSPYSRYHGDSLDEPIIRIPMFARVPGWPAGRVSEIVSSVDLVPTILGVLKVSPPGYLDGVDLAPAVLAQPNELGHRVLFSDTWRYAPDAQALGDFSAAYDGTLKYVLNRLTGRLYAASQANPRLVEHFVGMRARDGLSASVYAYSAELGDLHWSR